MESAAAILRKPDPAWEEPAEAGIPKLVVLEPPALRDEVAAREAIIPTPIRVRGRTLLARFGPPMVFLLTLAAIFWFWPPF